MLLGPVSDVDAFPWVRAQRDGVQAVQAHHVVQPNHVGVPEQVPDRGDEVPVPLLPDPLGVRWRESPVLPPREEQVGRSPGRGAQDERVPFAPHVEAVRVHPQRGVEVQAAAGPAGPAGQPFDLLVRQPLRVEVVAPDVLVATVHGEPAVPLSLGPLGPGTLVASACRPKPGVVGRLRVRPQEGPEGVPARGPPGLEEAPGQEDQHLPLGGHGSPVVDERSGPEPADLGSQGP